MSISVKCTVHTNGNCEVQTFLFTFFISETICLVFNSRNLSIHCNAGDTKFVEKLPELQKLMFRFSEKATKISKNLPHVLALLSSKHQNKSIIFLSNFVAFSQYFNFHNFSQKYKCSNFSLWFFIDLKIKGRPQFGQPL